MIGAKPSRSPAPRPSTPSTSSFDPDRHDIHTTTAAMSTPPHHGKTPAAFSMRSPYKAYRSPFGPKYTIAKHYHGFTLQSVRATGLITAGIGGALGFAALWFFAEVPKVRDDIMKKVPILDKFFTKEIAPEDNPF